MILQDPLSFCPVWSCLFVKCWDESLLLLQLYFNHKEWGQEKRNPATSPLPAKVTLTQILGMTLKMRQCPSSVQRRVDRERGQERIMTMQQAKQQVAVQSSASWHQHRCRRWHRSLILIYCFLSFTTTRNQEEREGGGWRGRWERQQTIQRLRQVCWQTVTPHPLLSNFRTPASKWWATGQIWCS